MKLHNHRSVGNAAHDSFTIARKPPDSKCLLCVVQCQSRGVQLQAVDQADVQLCVFPAKVVANVVHAVEKLV